MRLVLYFFLTAFTCRADIPSFIEEFACLPEYRDEETGRLTGFDLYGDHYMVQHEMTKAEIIRLKGRWLSEHGYPEGELYEDLADWLEEHEQYLNR